MFRFFTSSHLVTSVFVVFFVSDPRVRNYPLINDGPGQVLMLAAGYLVFAILGPRVMKHFPAVNVPAFILFAYNFGLSLLSLYIVVQVRNKQKKEITRLLDI